MSILIKGVDMPPKGNAIGFVVIGDGTAKYFNLTPPIGKIEFAEAIEVPTSHGRLIDADKMVKEYHNGSFDVVKVAKAMPTVIESEEV